VNPWVVRGATPAPKRSVKPGCKKGGGIATIQMTPCAKDRAGQKEVGKKDGTRRLEELA